MQEIEVEFEVLCANEKESCTRVKGIMHDFKIESAKRTDSFDHKGTRSFNSVKDALRRVGEIKTEAGNDIIDIEIVVRK